MNKGLEAWQNINDNLELLDDGFSYDEEFARILTDDLDIIEKELKEGEKNKQTLEVIKKYPKNKNSLQNFRFMVEYWEKNNIEVTKELLKTYDFPFEIEEYDLLKEVLQ